MRWILFIILTLLVALAQITVVSRIRISGLGMESVAPDLLAIVAVFVALHAASAVDVMLAAWVLGCVLDLVAVGGPGGVTALGPMSLVYALAAGGLYRIRGAFFRDRILAQVVLGFLFCVMVHGAWVTFQLLLAGRWVTYPAMLLHAAAISVYTALLTPLGYAGLRRCRRLFMSAPAGRLRRGQG